MSEPNEDGWPCEFCGAYSRRSCEMEDEHGVCAWEEAQDGPDPDQLREDRNERRRLDQEDQGRVKSSIASADRRSQPVRPRPAAAPHSPPRSAAAARHMHVELPTRGPKRTRSTRQILRFVY